MNTKRLVLDSFSLELAPEWIDITETLADEDAPWSYARSGGAGMLQFSAAVHRRGRRPDASVVTLEAMLRDFAVAQDLGEPSDLARVSEPNVAVGGSFLSPEGFVRVWYVSDGPSFVLATYVCEEKGAEAAELPDCETMIASLRFDGEEDAEDETD